MKRTLFVLFTLLTFCSVRPVSARQANDTEKTPTERDVKTSGNYLYGEAVADTRDEAAKDSKELLASEINREAKKYDDLMFGPLIEAEDLEHNSQTIDLRRGAKFRVITYIPRFNMRKMILDKIPVIVIKTEEPVETEVVKPAPPLQTIIKMEKDESGIYLIPCKVNGMALKFTYDTGATRVVISMKEFDYMMQNNILLESDVKGTRRTIIADGSIIEVKLVVFRTMEIGDLIIRDVEANVIPTPNAPLLLGLSALSKLGKIEFDYGQGTLLVTGDPFNLPQRKDEAETEKQREIDKRYAEEQRKLEELRKQEDRLKLEEQREREKLLAQEERRKQEEQRAQTETFAQQEEQRAQEERRAQEEKRAQEEQLAREKQLAQERLRELAKQREQEKLTASAKPAKPETPLPRQTAPQGDLLAQIKAAPSMYEVKDILLSSKRKGKVSYGRMENILGPDTKYIVVYGSTGKIVALLDKGNDKSRRDLISGKTFGKEIFNDNMAIWFQIF